MEGLEAGETSSACVLMADMSKSDYEHFGYRLVDFSAASKVKLSAGMLARRIAPARNKQHARGCCTKSTSRTLRSIDR